LFLVMVLNVANGIWIAVCGHWANDVRSGVAMAIASGACAAVFGYMLTLKTKPNEGAEENKGASGSRIASQVAPFIVLLVLAGTMLAWQYKRDQMFEAREVASTNAGNFSYAEWNDFLAAARKAETIADREQRCLAYPDPPGSHWPRATIATYCSYLFQPTMSRDEVKGLIAQGRFSELDRREADKLGAERTESGARGQFDNNFGIDFFNDSADLRSRIDLWVAKDPGSAFAHAASGASYVAMAETVRGDEFDKNTPKAQLDAMRALLEKARTELRRALAINPRVTSAYVAMMDADRISGDRVDAESASQQGLGVDPANFAIYDRLLWQSRPKWGGSLGAMQETNARMRQHLTDNPLLSLLMLEAAAVEANMDCACDQPVRFDQYRKIFVQPASNELLGYAGLVAEDAHKYSLGVVYLSEALRFRPVFFYERVSRANALAALGQLDWAKADAELAIAARPKDQHGYAARGYILQRQGYVDAAVQDYEKVLTLTPNDIWTERQLGYLYTHNLHEWDKAWDLADRMIQQHPDQPDGWVLRACVQQDQPRPGLRETAQYVVDHFGNDPDPNGNISYLRSVLANLDRKPKAGDPRKGGD